jgi:hypothetical protein
MKKQQSKIGFIFMKTISESNPLFTLVIRVYGKEFNPLNSHGYLVDDTPTCTSTAIGELNINIRALSFKQLRPMIEYDRSNNMMRRNMVFQEALFIMSRLPNYSDLEKKDLLKYRFGFFKRDEKKLALVIKPEDEDRIISEVIAEQGLGVNGYEEDIFLFDLVLVPLSQIT